MVERAENQGASGNRPVVRDLVPARRREDAAVGTVWGYDPGGLERHRLDKAAGIWERARMQYADRSEAGHRLAAELLRFKDRNPVVLALPRGGVAVGFEIAHTLAAPLDVVLVRKIGVPWQPELALGAVTDGAVPDSFVDRELAARLGVLESYIEGEIERALSEIERRRGAYCAGRPPIAIAGRTAIVVDDGIATGATMRVALRAVRRQGPARLVLAVPVAPPETPLLFRAEADEIVCPEMPPIFGAIGYFYRDFHQMSDAEVTDLLARASPPVAPDGGRTRDRSA